MSDEDGDPLAQHLELITKRVEKIVNGRMQYLADQFTTAINDMDEIRARLTRIEDIVKLQVQNNVFLMRNVNLMVQEHDALMAYLAKSDPILKKLLLDCLDRQRAEINRRDGNPNG